MPAVATPLLTVPSASYLAGLRSFETPSDISSSLSELRVKLTLETWPVVTPTGENPDGACIETQIFWSPDSGVNFFPLMSWRAPGFVTPPLNKFTGLPVVSTDSFVKLHQVGNPNRRIRVRVENFATMLTAVSMEAT